MDSLGMSRGVLMAWNLLVANFKDCPTVAGILAEGKIKGFHKTIRGLNMGLIIIGRYFGSWKFS